MDTPKPQVPDGLVIESRVGFVGTAPGMQEYRAVGDGKISPKERLVVACKKPAIECRMYVGNRELSL